MQIVQAFLLDFGEEMQRTLNRILPFEQVLWDVFEVSARVRGTVGQVNVSFLRDNLIIEELKRFYHYSYIVNHLVLF